MLRHFAHFHPDRLVAISTLRNRRSRPLVPLSVNGELLPRAGPLQKRDSVTNRLAKTRRADRHRVMRTAVVVGIVLGNVGTIAFERL